MSEEDDILEKLFKDKLENVELPVSENLWKGISQSIGRKGFWKTLNISIVAVTVTGLSVFFVFHKSNEQVVRNQEKIVSSRQVTDSSPEDRVNEKQRATDKNANSETAEEKKQTEPELINRKSLAKVGSNTIDKDFNTKKSGLADGKTNVNSTSNTTQTSHAPDASKNIAAGNYSKSSQTPKLAQTSTSANGTTSSNTKSGQVLSKKAIAKTNADSAKEQTMVQNEVALVKETNSSTQQNNIPENQNTSKVNAAQANPAATGTQSATGDQVAPGNQAATGNRVPPENQAAPENSAAEKTNATGGNSNVSSGALINGSLASKDSVSKISQQLTAADTPKQKPDSTKSETNPVTSDSKMKFFAGAEDGMFFPLISSSAGGTSMTTNTQNGVSIQNSSLLHFGMILNKHLNVVVGFGVSTFNGVFTHTGTNSVSGSDSVIAWIRDTNGVLVPNGTRDSTFVNKKNYTQTLTLTAQFLTIPIFAEYVIYMSKNWSLTPSLGIVLNYLLSAQSTYTNTLTSETLISDKTNFKTLTASGLGGMQLEYMANEKWSIFLAARYSLFAGNLYKDAGVLKIAPSGLSTNVGLRYYFKGHREE